MIHLMIHTQNDMLDYKFENEGCTVVNAAAFPKMIDAALESGDKNGVSREYITGFLCGKNSQEDGPSEENWTYFEKETDN